MQGRAAQSRISWASFACTSASVVTYFICRLHFSQENYRLRSRESPLIGRVYLYRILEEDMVLTVEPGCYFNPFLLKPALDDLSSAKFLIRDRIESLLVCRLSLKQAYFKPAAGRCIGLIALKLFSYLTPAGSEKYDLWGWGNNQ